ncbi:MAG: carbohydrate ABC transporter permease [Lentisphaeria bacterium]|nr:MAG: carbohydrate ABC transporter permease [Lentisphaeria bacterium]
MARVVRSKFVEFWKHVFILIILFFAFVPFYLMLTISLKDNQQFARNPWFPEPPFHWANYVYGWEQIGGKIFNTAFIAMSTTVLTLVCAVVGAFFFARYRMPGSKFLFGIFVILMMYPAVANMVPMFKLITSLGLYNTHFALILPGIAGGQAFNIFVLRNFIEDIPQDLFDAIEIDGGNTFYQIWHVVVPMSMPILGTLGILSIIGQWNNFVSPAALSARHQSADDRGGAAPPGGRVYQELGAVDGGVYDRLDSAGDSVYLLYEALHPRSLIGRGQGLRGVFFTGKRHRRFLFVFQGARYDQVRFCIFGLCGSAAEDADSGVGDGGAASVGGGSVSRRKPAGVVDSGRQVSGPVLTLRGRRAVRAGGGADRQW